MNRGPIPGTARALEWRSGSRVRDARGAMVLTGSRVRHAHTGAPGVVTALAAVDLIVVRWAGLAVGLPCDPLAVEVVNP